MRRRKTIRSCQSRPVKQKVCQKPGGGWNETDQPETEEDVSEFSLITSEPEETDFVRQAVFYSSAEASVYDSLSGSFRASLSGIELSPEMNKVRAAVWSDVNGQDDLTWIDAKESGGQWYADVDTGLHQYDEGVYNVHFYAYDSSNNGECIGCFSHRVTVDRTKTKMTGTWNPSAGTLDVMLSDYYGGRDVTAVRFAVWSSENGQDDLKWYGAVKNQGGIYRCTVPLTSHKGTGLYYIHAYSDSKNKSQYVNGTGVSVQKTAAKVSATVTNADTGSFRVNITNVTLPETVKEIRAAVWSRTKGQDDLTWITAARNGTTWYADVNTGDHIYDEGIYDIHIYITDKGNNSYMSAGMSQNVKVKAKPKMNGSWNPSAGTITVALTGMNAGRNVTGIRFAVWSSESGQDDLKWYQAARGQDGVYRYTVPMTSHKGTGSYFIHAYADTPTGSRYVSGTGVDVGRTGAKVSAAVTNTDTGSFRVNITNLTLPGTVKSVRVAVWSRANGQDDLTWLNASKNGNNWYADVNTAVHQYEEGTYDIHVYVTDHGNNSYMSTGTTHNVRVDHTKPKMLTSVDSKNGILTVKVLDANLGRNESEVKIPVWTVKNGQDDLNWHSATRNSDGSWSARIDLASHYYETGVYEIHVYGFAGSSSRFITGTEITVSIEMPYVRRRAREILNQIGWDLRAAFQWSAGLTYYRPTPKPDSGESHTVHYGQYGYQNGKGNCYVMAATFYWMARELGYEVYMVEGYVRNVHGGLNPHGWTEIVIDGYPYLFDPNFTNETGRDGYMIYYGKSGTWRYANYGRVY